MPHANLVWRHWNDEYVFHHFGSNDTHRLAELPGQLVAHLALHGRSTARVLAAQFDIDEADTEYLLDELEKLDFLSCLT